MQRTKVVSLALIVALAMFSTGLAHAAADTAAVHSLSPTTWLSGVRPKPTQGTDALAGITADQIAAQQHLNKALETMAPCAIEQNAGADDVGVDEIEGRIDAAIDV